MKKYFFLIIIILLFSNCSEDLNNSDPGLSVKTNKSAYTNSETITFAINNFNSTTVHLTSCCSSVAFYIEKYENGNWVNFLNFGLPCFALCPGIDLTISYMETIIDSIHINENGNFRIKIPYNLGENKSFEILSNKFTIE